MDLDLDQESLARDLDPSDLQYPLAQGTFGGVDKYLDLESPFPTATQVEVEEIVVDLPPEQVRRVADPRDYAPSAEKILRTQNSVIPYHVQNKHYK